MTSNRPPTLRAFAPALLLAALSLAAHADTLTQTGTFSADNDAATYNFTLASAQTVTIYTTSYGGGANLDGTTSSGGGFATNLSLFTGAGAIVAGSGGSGVCHAGQQADASTGLCNDAYLSSALDAGSYELVLTELPNVALGDLAGGFLFGSDPNATGTLCNQSGGQFLDTTTVPCTQRSDDYAWNLTTSSPVPEPPTWALVLPGAGLVLVGRRYLA